MGTSMRAAGKEAALSIGEGVVSEFLFPVIEPGAFPRRRQAVG